MAASAALARPLMAHTGGDDDDDEHDDAPPHPPTPGVLARSMRLSFEDSMRMIDLMGPVGVTGLAPVPARAPPPRPTGGEADEVREKTRKRRRSRGAPLLAARARSARKQRARPIPTRCARPDRPNSDDPNSFCAALATALRARATQKPSRARVPLGCLLATVNRGRQAKGDAKQRARRAPIAMPGGLS